MQQLYFDRTNLIIFISELLESFLAFSVVHFYIKPLIVLKSKLFYQRLLNHEGCRTQRKRISEEIRSHSFSSGLQEDIEETYTLDKTNSVLWELSTRPGTAGAATYKFQGRILAGDETPRQMMRWRQDVTNMPDQSIWRMRAQTQH